MRTFTLAGLALTATLTLAACNGAARGGAAAEAENLLPNPSFEKGEGNSPAGWKHGSWAGKGEWHWADTGRSGDRAVCIESADGADIAWTASVPVEPLARYRLSGYIKTENVETKDGARGALMNVHNLQPTATKAVTGTRGWTKVEVEFETQDQTGLQVNCLFGGWGQATGKAWWDDVSLVKIGEREMPRPAVRIDAAKAGHPISKYVYGQFIEHLGRCIYGGIWAEMLIDRKFFYPVTPDYDPYGKGRRPTEEAPFPILKASPWQAVGKKGAVTMVKEDSFVGDHTPRIAPGGGIAQRDLGLVKGKEYVGYIWTRPVGEETRLEVGLRWGDEDMGTVIENDAGAYRRDSFRFTAGATTNDGVLEIRVTDKSPCLVGTVSLMPADHAGGMRADTLALLRRLDSPVYRWPGGNFVSGYDWQDGVGPRDRRPPRKNPAWTGVESNDFGLHEFLHFCETLGADPYIAVNSGLGGVEAAADQVEYVNGPADAPMGERRAENGRPEPWKVRFWGIGNEMYGGWQLGHMPLEDYVKKHNAFAKAMREVDPSIQLVAVGAAGKWSETMLRECAEAMDLISEHFYCRERPGLVGHVRQIPDAVRAKTEAHRRYRREIDALKGKDIDIALDEWNYWYGPHVFGELGTRYFLKDALGIAAGLHEMFRESDLFYMANYAQTVNVIGAIKTTRTAAAMETTGLALEMYRRHFGTVPVATEVEGLVNAMAAWTDDRKALTVGVVNPTRRAAEIPLDVAGARLTGKGTRWVLTGPGPQAYNHPGRPPKVTIEEGAVRGADKALAVPAYSVTIFALEVK
ncbi:MAG: alpha-L-arabinofuranosidase C-terminal domain-containing protein [Phycisphaerae bacterium]